MGALSDLDGQGSKQITANLVELRQNRKDLSAAVTAADKEGDFPESIRVQVEDSLEQAPALEIKAAIRQDELEAEERTERVDLQQRPRLRFSTFSGQPEEFNIFLKNSQKLFQLYPTAEQRILQMAQLVKEDLRHHILRYLSSGEAGPELAIENMTAKFGMKKLIKPVLLAKLKNMITARDNSSISAKAEEVLSVLESLAQMEPDNEEPTLPQDVLPHIFRALRLS